MTWRRSTLRKVVKYYDDVEAVSAIDLDIADKEFVVLVGPSGCGKSTTLRMIAGLEEITDGEIAVDGEVVNDVPPKDRDMAMVFQNYALYPHMTVYQNMSFGLRLKHYPKDEIEKRVQEAARILDIKELLDRKPRQLSGGQRQRVAMGRAIVRNPKVFLFDEPLSNLDAKLRVQMRTEIKRVHQKVRTTTVYVTHDQVEAMTLADRVVVMNRGKIEQIGAPNFLYHSPATRFVAGFIGSPAMNFIPCRLEQAGEGLNVRLSDTIAFAVPAERVAALSRAHAGKDAHLRHPAGARDRGQDQRLEEPRDVRCRHRGGRADGQRDDGVLLDQRHRGVRAHRSERRRQGRLRAEDGGAPRPHAPDRQRVRQRAVTAVPDLAGKVAWVTGAGSGIGEAAALALAREGAAVALTGRRREPLQAVADRIAKAGGKALVAPGDLGEQEAASRIAATIAKEFGRLDILVNNAGANVLERSWAKLDARAHQDRARRQSQQRVLLRARGARRDAAAARTGC